MPTLTPKRELFKLGQIVATPGAIEAMQRCGVGAIPYLQRHVTGDWGILCDEDKAENEFSVTRRLRIFSAYLLPDETKIWIITEADRSSTCVLLPDEY